MNLLLPLFFGGQRVHHVLDDSKSYLCQVFPSAGQVIV